MNYIICIMKLSANKFTQFSLYSDKIKTIYLNQLNNVTKTGLHLVLLIF